MKAITRSEAEHLFIERQMPLDDRNLPTADPSIRDIVEFSIPEDAGKRVFQAKALLRPFEGKKTIVWVDDWGVWPSGEHQHMFYRFRQSYGEARLLIEAPVHIFGSDETEDALSVFCFCILFLWDCYVVCPETKDIVFISHDEVGWAVYEDKANFNEVKGELKTRA